MGTIKSAWEIALEKSEGLTVNKEELKQKESFKKGRAFGLKSLEHGFEWAENEFKNLVKDSSLDQKSLIQGILEALIAPYQLSGSSYNNLPTQQAQAIFKLVTKKDGSRLFEQMQQVVNRYHDELENLKQAIIQQLGPRLQQRAEQMARQAGVSANYVIERDPEFQKIFSQNADHIRQQLQDYLEKLKAEFRRAF